MSYRFGKLWHLAIIWAIRKAFQCIPQGVRILLAKYTRISPTSENDSYVHKRCIYVFCMDWGWIGSVIDNRQWRAWLHFGDGGLAPDNVFLLSCYAVQCIRLYWLVPKIKLDAKSQHQIVLNLQLPLFFWAMLQPTMFFYPSQSAIFLQKNNLYWLLCSTESDPVAAITLERRHMQNNIDF